MVMKKSARGSVGRAFSASRRWKRLREDDEYREKQNEWHRKYYSENREKEIATRRKMREKLNEFANKRCVVCSKLLNYKNKSGFCKKHWAKNMNKILKERRKKIKNG